MKKLLPLLLLLSAPAYADITSSISSSVKLEVSAAATAADRIGNSYSISGTGVTTVTSYGGGTGARDGSSSGLAGGSGGGCGHKSDSSHTGGSGTANAQAGNGYDIVLDTSQDFGAFAADLFVGYSTTEQPDTSEVAGGDKMKDREEGTAGLTVSLGPIKAGYQRTLEYTGQNQVASDVFGYKNTSWGVSFNVNDNLSVSYAEFESLRGLVEGTSGIARPVTTVESIQAAYTMGGVSLKVALNDLDNGTYTTGSANDAESS